MMDSGVNHLPGGVTFRVLSKCGNVEEVRCFRRAPDCEIQLPRHTSSSSVSLLLLLREKYAGDWLTDWPGNDMTTSKQANERATETTVHSGYLKQTRCPWDINERSEMRFDARLREIQTIFMPTANWHRYAHAQLQTCDILSVDSEIEWLSRLLQSYF